MAAGQSSGRDWTGASGRLLGRVHLSIQSPYIQVSREAVLSIGSTSRAGRPRPICNLGQTTTCCIWWRQVNTPIMQKSGCGNESARLTPLFQTTLASTTAIRQLACLANPAQAGANSLHLCLITPHISPLVETPFREPLAFKQFAALNKLTTG